VTQAVLALADGTVFVGESFGAAQKVVGEVVFNTSMFGYQEILTDPSYAGQIVTMAYPEMGNVGTNGLDAESVGPHAVGMAVRALSSRPSSWRSELPLEAFLEKHGRAGISGIDTRRLVRHLRTRGSQMGVLACGDKLDINALVDEAREAPGMEGQDLVSGVSTRAAYVFDTPTPSFLPGQEPRVVTPRFEVVTIDYGLKRSMLHQLVDVGCRVTVLPSGASAEEILARRPDGVFLANGPGDPAAVPGADRTVAALLGKVPVFGICMGHQILARALGAKTYKMKFGHRGGNQPVKDLATGRVEITSQNHGFAVDGDTLPAHVKVSHVNLNDGTVEGIEVPDARAFSVQYHPESSPGPHDARYLFARFTELMGS